VELCRAVWLSIDPPKLSDEDGKASNNEMLFPEGLIVSIETERRSFSENYGFSWPSFYTTGSAGAERIHSYDRIVCALGRKVGLVINRCSYVKPGVLTSVSMKITIFLDMMDPPSYKFTDVSEKHRPYCIRNAGKRSACYLLARFTPPP
jgi:hypothetical protein